MDSLFSFPVGLFHPLQHAGLSRRTTSGRPNRPFQHGCDARRRGALRRSHQLRLRETEHYEHDLKLGRPLPRSPTIEARQDGCYPKGEREFTRYTFKSSKLVPLREAISQYDRGGRQQRNGTFSKRRSQSGVQTDVPSDMLSWSKQRPSSWICADR